MFLVKANFNSEGDTIHFVGDAYHGAEGRVSSAIQSIDKKKMRGISRSGRVYGLKGESNNLSSNALYVFNNWLKIAKDPEIEDITKQFE